MDDGNFIGIQIKKKTLMLCGINNNNKRKHKAQIIDFNDMILRQYEN